MLKKSTKILTVTILLITAVFLFYSNVYAYASRDKVKADIDSLIVNIESIHISPYINISKKRFYYLADSIKKSLPKKVSNLQAYKLTSFLVNALQLGHTNIKPPIVDVSIAMLKGNIFPYEVAYFNNKLFIKRSTNKRATIPIGSEIISINGKAIPEIILQLKYFVVADSELMSNYQITNNFSSLLGIAENFSSYKIKYTTPSGIDSSTTIKSILFANIASINQLRKKQTKSANYTFSFLKDSTAYFKCLKFNDYNQFKELVDTSFLQIQKAQTKRLIIDVRGNGGGNSQLGDYLLQRIARTPFKVMDTVIMKASAATLKSFPTYTSKFNQIDTFVITEKVLIDTIKNRFRGQIFLLIDNGTYSSAVDFAAGFKSGNCGIIIGRETGGLQKCFGETITVKLPNTGINLGVACKYYVHSNAKSGYKGIIPDIPITYTLNDYLNNIDKELNYLYEHK